MSKINILDDPLLKKHSNLYEVLGVTKEASLKEIKSAYRKKALECHPDKNLDDPKANEMFHELSKVLEILIDEGARAAYDKILTAKLAAKLRNDALDSRRKRLKEDLEERERMAGEKLNDWKSFEDKFEKEIIRLRKQASEEVKLEMEKVKNLIKESKIRADKNLHNAKPIQFKLKWLVDKDDPGNGVYTDGVIRKIFSKYGSVSTVIVSAKKKGSALIEFSDSKAAANAYRLEKGFADNPLKMQVLGTDLPEQGTPFEPATVPHFSSERNDVPLSSSEQDKATNSYDDFEAQVLKRLREAEMNKRKQNEAVETT